MQDKFVCDIGDFAKYALLRTLTGVTSTGSEQLSLGVLWHYIGMNTTNRKYPDYLKRPDSFRARDPHLFDRLRNLMDQGNPTLVDVEMNVKLGQEVTYWRSPVPSDMRERRTWLHNALDHFADRDLIFLDPDKGLLYEPGSRPSTEHTYLYEVDEVIRNSELVVLYHSFNHKRGFTHARQIRELLECFRLRLGDDHVVFAARWNMKKPRVFLVIGQTSWASQLRSRLFELLPMRVDGWTDSPPKEVIAPHFTVFE